MSLRRRLALASGAIVALAVMVGGIGAHRAAHAELRAGIDDFLADRVAAFQLAAGEGRFDRPVRPERPNLRVVVGGLLLADTDAIVQIVGVDTDVVFAVDGAEALPVDSAVIDEVRRTRTIRYEDVDLSSGRHRMATAALPGGAVVQVARSLDETEAALAGLRNRILVLVALTTAAAAVVGWLVARHIARPIERLADTAEHVARTQQLETSIAERAPERSAGWPRASRRCSRRSTAPAPSKASSSWTPVTSSGPR